MKASGYLWRGPCQVRENTRCPYNRGSPVSISVGTRVGAYEITAPIGAGGMGEVYRARDARLDRDVAIKILPDAFVHDPDRVARFQREAKTLAALNHPNIAGIYGIEESGDTHAIVLEMPGLKTRPT